jgi:hypothetical protein
VYTYGSTLLDELPGQTGSCSLDFGSTLSHGDLFASHGTLFDDVSPLGTGQSTQLLFVRRPQSVQASHHVCITLTRTLEHRPDCQVSSRSSQAHDHIAPSKWVSKACGPCSTRSRGLSSGFCIMCLDQH